MDYGGGVFVDEAMEVGGMLGRFGVEVLACFEVAEVIS